ncbi:MAG: mechanosensitive ion channel [Halioglobus sp.]|nr:mechanosensitive ion channel [Halioglobus sp.]
MPVKSFSLIFFQIILLFGFYCSPFAAAGVNVEPEISADIATNFDSEMETLQSQLTRLDQDISVLEDMRKQVNDLPKQDREALLFRLDERSFDVFQRLDEVIQLTIQLPTEDAQRMKLEKRLRRDLADISNDAFASIVSLDNRVAGFKKELASFDGGQRIAREAYINSLELLRIQYLEKQVEIIEGKKSLDMPIEIMRQRVEVLLYLRAETLVGKLQFAGSALKEMRHRLARELNNAELDTTVKIFSNLHEQYLQRLAIISELLQRLGVDNTAYAGVLLQQGKSFSVRDLKGPAFQEFLRDSWRTMQDSLEKNSPDIIFRLLVFILVIFIFRILSRLTRRATVAACDRSSADLSLLLKDTLATVSSGTVMVVGLLMALSQIGISLGPMLAGLGVAGFVIGFALQDTLSNFAAGAMILIYRPYDVDDFVQVTGASGRVKKMSLVSTTITTFDNQTLIVPNSKIWGDVIKNVTAEAVRRVDLEFGIGYGDDIEHAERVLIEVVDGHNMVLKSPEATIRVHSLGDSSVNFIVRPWAKTEDYWQVHSDLTREIKMRFDKEGISIPFPQRDIHLYTQQEKKS